jgi:cobalt-zinc-cadmium efflux system outer membrane protein
MVQRLLIQRHPLSNMTTRTRARFTDDTHIAVARLMRQGSLLVSSALSCFHERGLAAAVLLWALVAFSSRAAAQEAIAKSAFAEERGTHSESDNRALTLGALLDSVAAGHPLFAASRARVRAAEATREAAGVFSNPVFGFEVDNAAFPWQHSVTLPAGMERESMTTATIPLEPLYQRSPRIRQAEAELRATRANAFGERQRVAGEAARAFYRTALAQVGVDVARDLASWLDTLVSYNSKRVSLGAAAESDLIRSQLERDRALADEAVQEAELARARAQLSSFLGEVSSSDRPVPRSVIVSAGSTPLPLSLATRDTLAAHIPRATQPRADSAAPDATSGVGQRPDVMAARERVTAARAAITSERTMLFRELGATFGVKQSAGTSTMIAGVSLPIPIFDQNRGQVAHARAEHEIAVYELADRERTANAEVSGAREAARLLTERALLLTGGTPATTASSPTGFLARAEESRRIALGAYREGAVPLIQVLDAARAWGEARRAFYHTLYEQHESVLDLLAAEGIDLHDAINASTQHSTSSPSHD